MHLESKEYFKNILKASHDELIKCIILTPHLPIYELTHPKYRSSFFINYQQWFHGDLNDIICENSSVIEAWVYGHTHTGSVQKHHDVLFYCNPLGYKHEDNIINMNSICVAGI